MEHRLPKNVLYVKDFSFILPDDFEGTLEDAFMLFLEYRKEKYQTRNIIDPKNEFNSLEVIFQTPDEKRVCGLYGIFHLSDEEKYELVEGTTVRSVKNE